MTLLFWFTLALVSAPAVALAAPQIPEDFRGTWCVDRELTAGVASGPCSELSGANFDQVRCLSLGDDLQEPQAGAGFFK
jgi:hypothetical protein